MTPEGKIKKLVNVGLKDIQTRHPGKVWVRMPVTRGMGKPWLDYHLCVNGQTVAIETKKDEKTPLTPQQKHTKHELEQAGAIVFKVDGPGTATVALQAIELLIVNPDQFHAFYVPNTREQAEQSLGGSPDEGNGATVL